MATINNNLYIRVQERMKEKGFAEQEIKTIDEARGKLRTHSKTIMRFYAKLNEILHVASIGAFAGATATFLLGKNKKV